MRRSPWRSLAAAMLAGALLASPWTAVAQSEDSVPAPETESWAKFFDYALCAVSIASATTAIGGVMAVVTCGKVAASWWTE
jgi:hypothetical protein